MTALEDRNEVLKVVGTSPHSALSSRMSQQRT